MSPLDRRALLKSVLVLVGAAAVGAPDLAFAQGAAPRFLSAPRFALLDEVSALIIPKTDTPGAREAGVPNAIDSLLADWASAETQQRLVASLDALDAESRAKLGAPLPAAPAAGRLAFLRDYDAAAIARQDRGYMQLKQLVMMTYYLSEPGATEELRYEHVPGVWEPWIPAGPDTRAWAV
ncbi:gluconate 2-dehydrogenase subunit 3 family protein [Phenylobacterium deserti]|nr:gluconate 2-dehydrogenase subunit 3 family protein [Phenylobacterium deserti]